VVVTTPQPVVSAPPPPSEGDPDLVEEAEGDF
jgi:hypothetical protein